MLTHLRGLGGQSGSRTKENEGLSVSNAHEIRYGLATPRIRPAKGIMISFSPGQTYQGGSTWLPWIPQPGQ
jgi:hypothetical protein